MEQLCLSGPIMALKRTPAEKILLAHVCQRAATRNGQCTDTNKELARAVAMHPQTVSDLVNKLRDILSMTTSADNPVAGQRILTPPTELVAAYQPVNDGLHNPLSESLTPTLSNSLTPLSDSLIPSPENNLNVYRPVLVEQPAADQVRRCVVTGVDISQQVGQENFINRQTIRQLRQTEPELFAELATQLLPFDDLTLLSAQAGDLRLAGRLRWLAKPRVREAALALAPFRECPISGADITHQGRHYPFVTAETLKMLLKHDRPAFDQIVARLGALYKSNRKGFDQLAASLLAEPMRQGSPADQCFALSSRIKRLAKLYQ